ncbi:uncharacterized protein C8R40DRAFT_1090278 [Lentinula edodes]|uniref:uncharacterized protein n=1 Tax=Lentinula edodes TaxID=5353 RepID=UPI001E8DA1F2|nr:uncharacterized protein C8R40DRAFT_1090278 [Lentinula edodes]KAH7878622.1 hypothetical protein C8R40DRAFT_1090278 [Lentinula edodes]
MSRSAKMWTAQADRALLSMSSDVPHPIHPTRNIYLAPVPPKTQVKNGFCAALDDLVALSGMGKDAYLTDIKTKINQKTNLYNIPKDTNAAKNHITAKFKAGNGASNAATAPFDPENVIQWGRVKTYLNTPYVSSNAATLVKSIDTKATALLEKAELDAKGCQASQNTIDSAKAKFEPSEVTMASIWENYVKYVTTQAKVKN